MKRFADRIPEESTPVSRAVGYLLCLVGFLLVLGIAGWIEGGAR